jgi:hypothetical protein
LKYTPDDGDLVTLFYVPALECAVRYDRLTGYFRARALTLAARGLEGLIRNGGRMRLLVGCTLDQPEVDAIAKGAECRDQVKAHLLANPLKPGSQREVEALELLAWMVANQFLEVQVAVPCDEHRRPIPCPRHLPRKSRDHRRQDRRPARVQRQLERNRSRMDAELGKPEYLPLLAW